MGITSKSFQTFNNVAHHSRNGAQVFRSGARASKFESRVEASRNTPIEAVAKSRGLKLKRSGKELCGPCPVCGGRDRFAINTNKQVWNCRGCGTGGDVISLVQHMDGSDFPAAVAAMTGAGRLVEGRSSPRKPANGTGGDEDKFRQGRALAIWEDSGDLADTLALSYLTRPKATGGRALAVPEGVSGRVLRFHPHCPWKRGHLPALIAVYRDIRTDEPKAILRVGLTPDGRKIDRMALGPKAGCAVKLTADEDVEGGLHIGEGVETMIASMMQGFAPAWALGDKDGIAKFPVLAGVEALTLCVDHDANGQGQKASSICYDRWVEAGREVWSIIPNEVDADMNDLVAGAA
jgi:CHC2 zinc finger/Toprim domain